MMAATYSGFESRSPSSPPQPAITRATITVEIAAPVIRSTRAFRITSDLAAGGAVWCADAPPRMTLAALADQAATASLAVLALTGKSAERALALAHATDRQPPREVALQRNEPGERDR